MYGQIGYNSSTIEKRCICFLTNHAICIVAKAIAETTIAIKSEVGINVVQISGSIILCGGSIVSWILDSVDWVSGRVVGWFLVASDSVLRASQALSR